MKQRQHRQSISILAQEAIPLYMNINQSSAVMNEHDLDTNFVACPYENEGTEDQFETYRIASAVTAGLSIVGSSLIIFMVLRRDERGKRPRAKRLHNRLLFCMSVIDILNSAALSATTAPIPEHESLCSYGAMGNAATCTTQGFLIQLGLAIPFYNTMLCIYYVSIIRYNVSEKTLKKKYEAYMHVFSLIYPVITAIYAAVAGLYHGSSTACWLQNECSYSLDCWDQQAESQNKSIPILMVTITLISLLLFLIILTSIALIHCKVKETEQKSEKYNIRNIRSSFIRLKSHLTQLTNNSHDHDHDNDHDNDHDQSDSHHEYTPRNRNRNDHNPKRKVKVKSPSAASETKKQASLYIAAYLISYIWPIANIIWKLVYQTPFRLTPPFSLLIVRGIFYPLQGFWNFCTFVRPRYNALSREPENKGALSKIFTVITEVPGAASSARKRGVSSANTNTNTNTNTNMEAQTTVPERASTPVGGSQHTERKSNLSSNKTNKKFMTASAHSRSLTASAHKENRAASGSTSKSASTSASTSTSTSKSASTSSSVPQDKCKVSASQQHHKRKLSNSTHERKLTGSTHDKKLNTSTHDKKLNATMNDKKMAASAHDRKTNTFTSTNRRLSSSAHDRRMNSSPVNNKKSSSSSSTQEKTSMSQSQPQPQPQSQPDHKTARRKLSGSQTKQKTDKRLSSTSPQPQMRQKSKGVPNPKSSSAVSSLLPSSSSAEAAKKNTIIREAQRKMYDSLIASPIRSDYTDSLDNLDAKV